MIRRFFKDSAIYVIPSILTRGIGFFLLPVYTHYLTPSDYGVMEFLAVFFAILNLTLPLEISQAVARMMPDADVLQKRVYASTSFWFTAFGFTMFAVVVWLFPESMAQLVLGNEHLVHEVCIGSLAMIANALFYLLQNQLRFTSQSGAYAFVSIIFSLVTTIVAVTLIVGFSKGVMGVIWGQLAGSVLALSLAVYFSRITVPILFLFDYPAFKKMIAYSAPLVLSGIAVYLSLYADRWVLREFLGVEAVGIYSVAYRVATIVSLVLMAFQMSLTPLVYQHYKESGTPRIIGDIFTYFLMLVLPLIGFISLFSPEIIVLITAPEYHVAAKLIPWLTMAVVLMNVYVFSPGLGIANKTHVIALINIVSAAVNVGLNFILVPQFGAMGAAVATLCGSGVMAGMYFWLGNRAYAIAYRKWRSWLVLLVVMLLLWLSLEFVLTWQMKLLLWFVFVVTIVSVLMTRKEREKVRGII